MLFVSKKVLREICKKKHSQDLSIIVTGITMLAARNRDAETMYIAFTVKGTNVIL